MRKGWGGVTSLQCCSHLDKENNSKGSQDTLGMTFAEAS